MSSKCTIPLIIGLCYFVVSISSMTDVLNCSEDSNCEDGDYCSSDLTCKNCIICEKVLHRQAPVSSEEEHLCVKFVEECGDCLTGYLEEPFGSNSTKICYPSNNPLFGGMKNITEIVIAVCAVVLLAILLFLLFKWIRSRISPPVIDKEKGPETSPLSKGPEISSSVLSTTEESSVTQALNGNPEPEKCQESSPSNGVGDEESSAILTRDNSLSRNKKSMIHKDELISMKRETFVQGVFRGSFWK